MDEKKFLRKLKKLNKSQFEQMNRFVEQGKDRSGTTYKFEWEDKNLINYINLKFSEIKIYERDFNKPEDNTRELVAPLNRLIYQFNKRKINYEEFFDSFEKLHINLIKANQSERYIIRSDDYLRHYKESSATVIKGVGGMGKSHFLWECQNEIEEEHLYESLFLYGKYFEDINSIPWDDIIEYSKHKEFLFVFDAINEVYDISQRIALYEKIKLLKKCKFCRVFVSYRTYAFNDKIGSIAESDYIDSLMGNIINFSGVEFDTSILEMISNFKVDISYFLQLLYSNNPMQIRMLIESDILNNEHLYEELNNSPILSVTFIYEHYIKSACKRIWGKANADRYWQAVKYLARIMFDSNKTDFERSDVDKLGVDTDKFINDLKSGGYIDCYNNTYFFSWEQLSNYLIARSFLKDIQAKNVDETIKLFNRKRKQFPRIEQFLISAVLEKFKDEFNDFILFCKKTKVRISNETLLNLYIKNINDRKKLQKCIKIRDELEFFVSFAGLPNRVFNCESYFFDFMLKRNPKRIIQSFFFDKSNIIHKLKNNLYNLNGKYFISDNLGEFIKFAILCLYIPDEDIINLSEKIIYDIVELYDYGIVEINKIISKQNLSSLVLRSICNVISHVSTKDKEKYSNIINRICKNETFINGKVLMNYCKQSKLKPFSYVNFNKQNLFEAYKPYFESIKKDFDEFKSLGGIIADIRLGKLYYPLNMENYNDLRLNFKLLDIEKQKIITFNQELNKLIKRYNTCDCDIDIWTSMFQKQVDDLKIKNSFNFDIINQGDLFWGFICHLQYNFKFYGVQEDEIKWYRENRYRQIKYYPDSVSVIVEMTVEEYIGSLMCNYFNESCEVSYWDDNKIYLGFAPIKYEEERQLSLCSPIQSYNETIKVLDKKLIRKLNLNYKRKKDKKWVNSKISALNNVRCLFKPLECKREEWILLSCYIKNKTRYARTAAKRENINYSEECIIVYNAINYNRNKTLGLNSRRTIDIEKYTNSIKDYNKTSSDFCKYVEPIMYYSETFNDSNMTLPPSNLIKFLQLTYDFKRAAWLNKDGEIVIICNNDVYHKYEDDIGHSIYIKKSYFDTIKNELDTYYYVFTERLSYDTGFFSGESSMHMLVKNNRIIRHCMNNAAEDNGNLRLSRKCKNCLIYKSYKKEQEDWKSKPLLQLDLPECLLNYISSEDEL